MQFSTTVLGWICILAFFLGIYFTFCRAAWISIFITLLFFISIKLKFKIKTYFFLLFAALVFIITNKEELIYSFKENKNISTAPNTTAIEQTQSITNVSTDVSNAERLNRWSCAWRMFLDKPLYGFGPGTFQFQYLSYQLPDETTYISVFSPYNIKPGRGGSTHNEYLLLLSESGIFCLFAFLFLIIIAIATALKIIYQTKQKYIQQSMLWLLLGLFTYLIHSFFNNFMDTDKAAFLFWITLAMMVNLFLEHKKSRQQ